MRPEEFRKLRRGDVVMHAEDSDVIGLVVKTRAGGETVWVAWEDGEYLEYSAEFDAGSLEAYCNPERQA